MEKVKIEIADKIGYMTITNPPVNTLSFQTMEELHQALDVLEQNDEVLVILLQGSNGHFMAGAELNEFAEIHTAEEGTKTSYIGHELMDRIERFPKPVIALIEGACLGGGLELALACHIRIGTVSSTYGLPEVTLGLIPGAGGTQRLPKLIGISKAKKMILTGERVKGNKAFELGIIDIVSEDHSLKEDGEKLANQIAANGKLAVRFAIQSINAGVYDSPEQGYRKEKELFGACFETEDKKNRIQKFLSKGK